MSNMAEQARMQMGGDPGLPRRSAVAGKGQPHQPAGNLARHVFAVDLKHPSQHRLSLVLDIRVLVTLGSARRLSAVQSTPAVRPRGRSTDTLNMVC
jgi:hypothetical protein